MTEPAFPRSVCLLDTSIALFANERLREGLVFSGAELRPCHLGSDGSNEIPDLMQALEAAATEDVPLIGVLLPADCRLPEPPDLRFPGALVLFPVGDVDLPAHHHQLAWLEDYTRKTGGRAWMDSMGLTQTPPSDVPLFLGLSYQLALKNAIAWGDHPASRRPKP